ncbi:hypothetical protein NQ318_013856 [Aromia moschata]|uniref:Aminopeptidase N-like N-terminal domain-containing protein n=1 Tax=Aromia moschata TaxID=1265417 RepID=A0AAV8ZAR1_9CUCU|nr:hypothetical protein NQ318_013856 [Aromia moschata]
MIRPVSLGVPLRRGTKMRNLLRLLLIAGFASYSLSDPFLIEVTEDDGDDGDDGYGGYRLPGIHIPSSYIINLQVSADVFSGDSTAFNGTVVIDFQVTDETDNIQIHAPVDVDAVSLQGDGQAINISDYSSYNSTTAILTITAEEVLTTAVNYTLTIEYTGVLRSSNMNGFYRSEYYESDGTKHYLVTSKFEPTWARYAFPSFDEPQLKARFTLVLIYPRNLSLSALGNTPQQSVEDVDDEYEKVTFGESPVMSTYLVAFIVSRFTCSAGANLTDEVPYQVCSRPETEGDRAWAVEVGPPPNEGPGGLY